VHKQEAARLMEWIRILRTGSVNSCDFEDASKLRNVQGARNTRTNKDGKGVLRWSVLALVLSIGADCAASAQAPSAQPVNPDATPAARALLRDLDSISGRATIGGQHNYLITLSQSSDRVYDLTGKFPGIFGQDFGYGDGWNRSSTLGRAAMVQEVIRQYRAGAVIALMWHEVRPVDDEPVTFQDSVQGYLTDWEWHQLLTPGTTLNGRWRRQVDRIAGYLKELQDAGVPVLFRPYHEMNGNWFWWGGRPGPDGSAALYRQLYDRFVHVHHLNNLVWVWNVNSPNGKSAGAIEGYFPGAAYVDVLTMDNYMPFRPEFYDSMVALADPLHKPIALAEVGMMPSLELLAQQPRWAYFMMWARYEEVNGVDRLKEIFNAPNIISRGDARLSLPAPAPTGPPAARDVGADAEAHALLTRLADAKGKGILAGQIVGKISGANPVEAQTVTTAIEKQPAMIEIDLTGSSDAKAVVTQVSEAAHKGELALLRWTPPRPTDNAEAGALSDFEWQQMLKPGTDLNQRWNAQADSVAELLRTLADAHLAVLWSPYPGANEAGDGTEGNVTGLWWAGREGAEGSREIYLRLRERLTDRDNLHNLIWVWEAAMPELEQDEHISLDTYYPGPLWIDAIMLDTDKLEASRFPNQSLLADLATFANGKPLGARVARNVPVPEALTGPIDWRWVILSPEAASNAEALKTFYADTHVIAAP